VIEIVPYHPKYKEYIKTLNYEWLQKYFRIEENDILQLSNPEKEILDKGGRIYFALYNGEVVGTSSLMKVDEEEYELAKMAVTEKAQGLRIGKLLLEHCLQEAVNIGIKKISLFSNTKLNAAIALYKKYGFEEIPLPADIHYERANIKMIKYLQQ
jgi:ribosomal protein S18 acetylase RimI-like enzyme